MSKRDVTEEYLLEQAGWKVHECDSELSFIFHKATGQIVELWGDEELDMKLLKIISFISNNFKNQNIELES